MERNGKTLKEIAPGDRRRLSDARNAWRKMTDEQRLTFLRELPDLVEYIESDAVSRVLFGLLDALAREEER